MLIFNKVFKNGQSWHSIDIGRSWVQIQAGPSNFSLLWIVQTSCGTPPTSFPVGTRSFFVEAKQLVHDIDCTRPSRGRLRMCGAIFFTPLHTFMAWPRQGYIYLLQHSYLKCLYWCLVSLWHIQSSITKALIRPSGSFKLHIHWDVTLCPWGNSSSFGRILMPSQVKAVQKPED